MNEVSERLALPDEDIVLLVLMVLMIPLPVALKLIPAHTHTHTPQFDSSTVLQKGPK